MYGYRKRRQRIGKDLEQRRTYADLSSQRGVHHLLPAITGGERPAPNLTLMGCNDETLFFCGVNKIQRNTYKGTVLPLGMFDCSTTWKVRT